MTDQRGGGTRQTSMPPIPHDLLPRVDPLAIVATFAPLNAAIMFHRRCLSSALPPEGVGLERMGGDALVAITPQDVEKFASLWIRENVLFSLDNEAGDVSVPGDHCTKVGGLEGGCGWATG